LGGKQKRCFVPTFTTFQMIFLPRQAWDRKPPKTNTVSAGMSTRRRAPGRNRKPAQPHGCGKNGALLRHFILKILILPRQARDKHRESTQTTEHFLLLNFLWKEA
jgi:hypothetical protein